MNYLLFTSSLADAGTGPEPPGLEHATLLVSCLPIAIGWIDGPWNEEDFGWEFLTDCDGTHVSVLIQQDGKDAWLIMVSPISSARQRKTRLAVAKVARAIEGVLRADGRFKDVRRCDEAEYESLPRGRQVAG